MSELTKEIAKSIRYCDRKSKENMAEEIGHVVLMSFALMYDAGIDISHVLDSMMSAVDRAMIARQIVPKFTDREMRKEDCKNGNSPGI